MSISSEITRISGNVSDALTAIAQKGVTVPSGSNSDDLADLISQISGGGGITPTGTLNITANDTYDVTNYASAVVNVPSSGSSAWTKVAENAYQITHSGTGASSHATWATGHNEIWTGDKIVYIRIRDTAGKRNGYFYGSDTFFMNMYPANGATPTNATNGIIINTWNVSSDGKYGQRYGYGATGGYGVYAGSVYRDGRIDIRKRYNSTYSLTIDGTYKVEVYLLDPPTGTTIFE